MVLRGIPGESAAGLKQTQTASAADGGANYLNPTVMQRAVYRPLWVAGIAIRVGCHALC